MNKYEMVLWATNKDGDEVILSNKAENILSVIPLAKRDGFKNLRIAEYDLSDKEWNALDEFVKTLK